MTDQHPISQPPTARTGAPTPIFRRHWDGNGWTGVAPVTATRPAAQPAVRTESHLGGATS